MIAAWLVHLYTASGAVMGLMAAADITQNNYAGAFQWLIAACLVDATDGVLARAARVYERVPWFDGALLDNLVDYVTYVFVPVLFVWQALVVPDAWSIPVCALMLLSSAYGFSRADAKTGDGFFTGFPSYWNVVAFYLWLARWPPEVNLVILVLLSVLVFVPLRYVYPTRMSAFRGVTLAGAAVWAALLVWLVRRGPDAPRPVFWASLAFPVYYFLLSIILSSRRASARADQSMS